MHGCFTLSRTTSSEVLGPALTNGVHMKSKAVYLMKGYSIMIENRLDT